MEVFLMRFGCETAEWGATSSSSAQGALLHPKGGHCILNHSPLIYYFLSVMLADY